MDLYEQLLEERAEEEQRRGRSLPRMRGIDSKVLIRRLEDSEGRAGYVADLAMMHRLIKKGPRNAGEGMRLASLKAKYRNEYGELRVELRPAGVVTEVGFGPGVRLLFFALLDCAQAVS
jgi:hypothetical protein